MAVPTRMQAPTMPHGKPAGVSWQARLLNRFFRHAIKHPIRKNGISPSATRHVIRLPEWIPRQFGDFATVRQFRVAPDLQVVR